jgi:mannose-1-phosphate guanylyltransferase
MDDGNEFAGSAVFPVVMAGGAGTRFWPVSRVSRPKQLLNLFGTDSLIEHTVNRLASLAPMTQVLIVTGEAIASQVRDILPGLQADNIVVEPCARNTAPAIGLAAVVAMHRDPEAILAVMPSDHHIGDEEEFRRVARSAIHHALQGNLVTLGITPNRPETGYGYIQFGESIPQDVPLGDARESLRSAYRISRFVEKPSRERALTYLRDGSYLWNSGMFFFKASVILEEIASLMPALRAGLERLESAVGTSEWEQQLATVYADMEAMSIDYGIMEHSDRIVVLPASMGWSDVGSWGVLDEFGDHDSENVVVGEVWSRDSVDNVFYADGDHLIAAVGVKGLVVAVSQGAVLVVPKERSQEVRKVVAALQQKGLGDYT